MKRRSACGRRVSYRRVRERQLLRSQTAEVFEKNTPEIRRHISRQRQTFRLFDELSFNCSEFPQVGRGRPAVLGHISRS
jgi:hypothetical protein